MLTTENYHLAWLIYAGCSLGLLVVFARMIRSLKHTPLRVWLLMTAACLLWVPVRADPEQIFLAPATLVFLLELIFIEGEAGIRVMPLLAGSLVGTWVAGLILWCAWSFLVKYRRDQCQEKLAESHAEAERVSLLEESLSVNTHNS